MQKLLDSIEIKTAEHVQYAIIWMHGLGADANDFVSLTSELQLPNGLGVRFVFPNAPVRPITINNGMPMRGWYDILDINRMQGKEDEQGLRQSQTQINALIQQENARGIASDHIFLAGFSQGSAMALLTGVRYPEKLAGIIALSGYLPLSDLTQKEASAANKQTPIFMAHGSFDPVVPLSLGEFSRNHLSELAYPIEWRTYPMAHQVCLEEIHDISAFLQAHLAV